MNQNLQLLLETIRKLMRRNGLHNIERIFNKTRAEDISQILVNMDQKEWEILLPLIKDFEHLGELFSELPTHVAAEMIELIPQETLGPMMEYMDSDDLAELLRELPEEKEAELLALLGDEETEEVEELLQYPEDTAGGIMTPDFFAMLEEQTVDDAVKFLQENNDELENVFYLYVTNEQEQLVGVVSLRSLLLFSPRKKLKNIMSTDLIMANVSMHEEEVARMVARYNLLAVPVIDEKQKMAGIITVDDVIDVMREANTEDMLKMAGTSEKEIRAGSIFQSAKIRTPWLFASWIGGLGTAQILSFYRDTLDKTIALASFMPVILGMGGNVGSQSSTIIVRGLATGRIELQQLSSVILREVGTAMLLGLTYGCLLGVVAGYQSDILQLGFVVALGILSSMCIAGLIGSALPLLFHKLNIDPAVATGPFVSTTVDMLGVTTYFFIATSLIP